MLCKFCGAQGHTRLSCPYTKAQDLANVSYEDRVFWSYVHPADRPESLGGDGDDVSDDDHVRGQSPGGQEQEELPATDSENSEQYFSGEESSTATLSDNESVEAEESSSSDV